MQDRPGRETWARIYYQGAIYLFGRLIWLLVVFPFAVLFITLAVSNRHNVQLVLDPLSPSNPSIALEGPFFIYLFAVLLIGILIGGVAVWFGQRKWREAAQKRSHEAHEWRREAERLSREITHDMGQSREALPQPKG